MIAISYLNGATPPISLIFYRLTVKSAATLLIFELKTGRQRRVRNTSSRKCNAKIRSYANQLLKRPS